MAMIEKFLGEDVAFEGGSASYIRQQVELALKPLAALQKLGPDVEGQALLAMGSAVSKRIRELQGRTDG